MTSYKGTDINKSPIKQLLKSPSLKEKVKKTFSTAINSLNKLPDVTEENIFKRNSKSPKFLRSKTILSR